MTVHAWYRFATMLEVSDVAVAKRTERARVEDDGRIVLPADILRQLGWKPGDGLTVRQVDGTVTLVREPVDWDAKFAGKMGHVWGDHEDVLRYLDEERASWERAEHNVRR